MKYIQLRPTDLIKEGDLYSLTLDGPKLPMPYEYGEQAGAFTEFFWRKQKTMQEISEETLHYYSSHPEKRGMCSTNVTRCTYYDDGSCNMCAVGRCMIDAKTFVRRRGNFAVGSYSTEHLESALLPEYRQHPLNFWRSLQQFHDISEHFENGGLSQCGLSYYNRHTETWFPNN